MNKKYVLMTIYGIGAVILLLAQSILVSAMYELVCEVSECLSYGYVPHQYVIDSLINIASCSILAFGCFVGVGACIGMIIQMHEKRSVNDAN